MSDILVFAEHENGKVKKSAFELLSQASELAASLGGSVCAVLLGQNLDALVPELSQYGAKKAFLVESDKLHQYNTVAYVQALQSVAEQVQPSAVLASASAIGRDFLPRLAVRLKAGLASDVTGLRVEAGKLVAKKPVYSGKAFVDVVFNTAVQLVSVRPNSFPVKAVSGVTTEVVKVAFTGTDLINPIKEVVQGQGGSRADLTEAEVIVSGGRAMGSVDGFKVLQPLADLLGATVGASRAAVDSGYATHDMQVGQTGKVVNPKLYIACGISGAIQHLAGMRTSKVIVAINKDAEAPIFGKADYGIVGDLFTLVPLIAEEIKKLQH